MPPKVTKSGGIKGFAFIDPKTKKPMGSKKSKSLIKTEVEKAVAKTLETKLIPLTNFDESQPSSIQFNSLAYWNGFCLGSTQPTNWSGTYRMLGGVDLAAGTGQYQRVGEYVNMKKTRLTLDVEMNSGLETNCLHEFRVVAFRANRKNNPIGISKNPNTSLFLDTGGEATGWETAGFNGTDMMVQPLNKRDWVILYDRKFILSPAQTIPAGTDTSIGFNSKYPSFKRITFNTKHDRKVKYLGTSLNPPINMNYQIAYVVFARSIGKDITASKWECNTRGCTSFNDP